jgi:predicted nucleotidyltransferase
MAGMNLQAPPSLAELRRLAPVLHRLTQSHGGEGLRVFGSVARGVAEADSDLDLLVDFPDSPSFEQFMDLKLALEDLLNVRVDLVTRKGLRAEGIEALAAQLQQLFALGVAQLYCCAEAFGYAAHQTVGALFAAGDAVPVSTLDTVR